MTRALLAAVAALAVAACAVPATTTTGTTTTAATATDAAGQPPAPVSAPAPVAPAARGGAAADPVRAALAAADRPADAAAQDASRRTAEVMAFAQIQPGDRVLDMGAFTGHSSWVISGIVGPDGAVVAQNPAEWVASAPPVEPAMTALAAARSNVTVVAEPFDRVAGEPGSFDVVFSGLIYHDTAYMNVDRGVMNRRIYELLKPGGYYVVVDHNAAAGSAVRDAETLHRIDAARVRREIENVGFTLDAESDVLTRPEDDLTRNVFDDAIRGRTSQFVYRFVKPAS